MSGNQQKIPFVSALSRFAENKIDDGNQLLGKSLPCSIKAVVSSSVVTVKFEVQNTDPLGQTLPPVTVPVFGPEYIRYPFQVGDKGIVISADAYIGGVSGLGGGVATLVQQGNLATLVFLPIGNKAWAPTTSPTATVLYGVNGGGVTLLSDIMGQDVSVTLTDSGVAIVGDVTLQGDLAVTGNVTATGNITAGQGTADQVDLLQHFHKLGTANTTPPVPGS